MGKESKDVFFAEVREPTEVKRNILESLKDIVESLQRFEKFKSVRKEKIGDINKLRKTLKDINKLASELKNALPESKLRAIKIKHELKEKKVKTGRRKVHKKKEEIEEKKPPTELEKLEYELGAIEEKLKGLQ